MWCGLRVCGRRIVVLGAALSYRLEKRIFPQMLESPCMDLVEPGAKVLEDGPGEFLGIERLLGRGHPRTEPGVVGGIQPAEHMAVPDEIPRFGGLGAMGGKVMSEAELKALAKLPSREELLATLVATMNAPVQKFVRTLNEVPSAFVRTLAAVRDAKEAA